MEYWKMLREKVGLESLILNGAAGAILKDNKILLVKNNNKNLWQIPGGLQDFGESLEETIIREIKEELNLNLEIEKVISIFSSNKWNIIFRDNSEIQQVTVFFLMKGTFNEKDISIQKEEISEYRFYYMNDIPPNTYECCKRKIEIIRNWDGKIVLE
jgi:ADP-ribose pyrophosphatase YjhB (NUDIX family)